MNMDGEAFYKAAMALAHAIVEKRVALASWEAYSDLDDKIWKADEDDALFAVYTKKVKQIEGLEKAILDIAGVK